MAEVTTKALARNSAYALIAQVWRIGSRLILTPIIIAKLGLDGYGVWTLLFVICAYVGVVDVNFGIAYVKFTAEYDAKRDYRTLAQILGAGMTLVGSFAAVALCVLWMVRGSVLGVLGVPEDLLVEAGQALMLVSICLLMRMSIGCVFPVLSGLQRLDLRYKMGILASAVEFVVSIALLVGGWGLLALAYGHLCGQVVSTAMAWWLCRRLCPELAISPFHTSAAGLRLIVALGGRFQFLSIVRLLINQGTKLLISGLLGVSMIAIAEIARKLVSLGMAAGGAIVAPLMPAFSNLLASGERNKARSLYDRGSKAVSVACIPTFAFLGIFADRLIILWTGNDYPLAAWTLRWLAPVAFTGILTGMGTAALRARGAVRLELGLSLITFAFLAILYGPGYWFWGYKGMILAEVASGFVGSLWFLRSFARGESMSFTKYLGDILVKPLAVFFPVAALVAVLQQTVPLPFGFTTPRMSVAADLAAWGTLFAVGSALSAWFGLLSVSERVAAARFLPGTKSPAVRRMLRCVGD